MPVVVPLGVAVFGLLLWRLGVRRALSLPRAAVAAVVAVYAAGVVGNTLFPTVVADSLVDDRALPGWAVTMMRIGS